MAVMEWMRDALRRATEERSPAASARSALAVGLFGCLMIALGLERPMESVWLQVTTPTVWSRLLTLVPMCLLITVKHVAPVAAFVAGAAVFAVDVAFGGGMGSVVAFIDLTYAPFLWASAWARRRLAVAITVGCTAVVVLIAVLTGDGRSTAQTALVLATLFVTPVWWASSLRHHAQVAQMADQRADAAEALAAARRDAAVREERSRMARDLHDALAGSLSAVSIHAEAARAARDREAVDAAVGGVRQASLTAMRELRTLVELLRDDTVASPPRLREIDDLLAGVRAAGTVVDANVVVPTDLPASVDQSAYRIVQEALGNAVRHGVGVVHLSVGGGADALHLRVVNTAAPGAARRDGGGLGLVSMQERVRALGGRLLAGPSTSEADAWVVDASLPLPVTPSSLTRQQVAP